MRNLHEPAARSFGDAPEADKPSGWEARPYCPRLALIDVMHETPPKGVGGSDRADREAATPFELLELDVAVSGLEAFGGAVLGVGWRWAGCLPLPTRAARVRTQLIAQFLLRSLVMCAARAHPGACHAALRAQAVPGRHHDGGGHGPGCAGGAA